MAGTVVFAWLVHLYTALGAVVAFLTILRIEQQDFRTAFWLMTLAVVIDASDGTLARLARVKERITSFDGDRLEDIVDYANYVIVPSLLLLRADLLPPQDALWIAALPLIASAYGFCQKEAKTADHYFLGFPSYWNLVAFYLYVLGTPPWINAFLIIALCILVFVPIRYVYPSRSIRYRAVTNSLGVLWAILIVFILYTLPRPPRAVVLASLFYPVYYVLLSLFLNRQDPENRQNMLRH
jgi:phosphatidylcholine synthase